MPIRFRCPNCKQFLGISRAKAGATADCPNCGRTLRVPNLDGKVAPLSPPTLNKKDVGLNQALAALAELGTAPPKPPAKPTVAAGADPLVPPRAIVIEPTTAPAAIVVPIAAAVAMIPAPAAMLDPLAHLAGLGTTAKPPVVVAATAAKKWAITAACSGMVASFCAGMYVGRATTPTNSSVAHTDKRNGDSVAGASKANGSSSASEPAIKGRVTYVAINGESRPDSGARILALPQKKGGTSKLSMEGFRPDDHPQEFETAQAKLRALGGDFAIADKDGQYALSLPAAGTYRLVILSRFQARPNDAQADPQLDQLLQNYFTHPGKLIGQVQYHVSEIPYTGTGSAPHDQRFERPSDWPG